MAIEPVAQPRGLELVRIMPLVAIGQGVEDRRLQVHRVDHAAQRAPYGSAGPRRFYARAYDVQPAVATPSGQVGAYVGMGAIVTLSGVRRPFASAWA